MKAMVVSAPGGPDVQLMRLGQVRAVVSLTLPLEEAARAHELVESGASVGRILLKPA